jgi:hypothetical protein
MIYYIEASFTLDVVSLWSDPRQGVLKQKVPSPNPLLRHIPLIARDKDLGNIDVETVMHSLFSGIVC